MKREVGGEGAGGRRWSQWQSGGKQCHTDKDGLLSTKRTLVWCTAMLGKNVLKVTHIVQYRVLIRVLHSFIVCSKLTIPRVRFLLETGSDNPLSLILLGNYWLPASLSLARRITNCSNKNDSSMFYRELSLLSAATQSALAFVCGCKIDRGLCSVCEAAYFLC